jgi:mono/diheme cytochrome c family protein
MSPFVLKSLIAALLLAAVTAAALSMLTVLGRPDKASDPVKLRRFHRRAGFAFLGLLIVLSAFGVVFLRSAGDQLPLRAVFHYHLVFVLWAVILLKIGIVRFFKGFLRMAPALGMTLFTLAFVIVAAAAGTYLLRTSRPADAASPSDAARGERLFRDRCAGCHFADREEAKTGPGLIGLMKKDRLPASGRPATADNVAAQLRRPYRAMIAFPDLAGRDLADLLAYLGTL